MAGGVLAFLSTLDDRSPALIRMDWFLPQIRKRKPGESELRILRDGRIVLVAADEAVLDVGEAIDPEHPFMRDRKEARDHD